MWIIVVYSSTGIKMFEFDSEVEARAKLETISGNKVLSEVVYHEELLTVC
ncbi:hypothetical protein [Bacillus sp. Marseille-P3661]|nr:hypothetical protein [Bacillus sp. Marseille-P3661]